MSVSITLGVPVSLASGLMASTGVGRRRIRRRKANARHLDRNSTVVNFRPAFPPSSDRLKIPSILLKYSFRSLQSNMIIQRDVIGVPVRA
jgi:hypothetical protein